MARLGIPQVITVILLLIMSVLSGYAWNNTYKIKDYRNTSPGEWSQYFLKGAEFNKLVIEIDYVKGVEVNHSSVDKFKGTIQKYLEKPNGVDSIMSSEIKQVDSRLTYNISEIEAIEGKYRDYKPDAYRGELSLYVLYLNGWYRDENNSPVKKVLGLTYRASSITVFRDAIWYSEIQTIAWKKETAVLVHELGHLLGLVNIGYKSIFDHEHSILIKYNNSYIREYDNHCNDSHCVMFPEIESQTVNGTPEQTYSMDFCINCSQDISLLKSGLSKNIMSRYIFLTMLVISVVLLVIYLVRNLRKKEKSEESIVQEIPKK